jgi:uncharacterized SAM-binding protein YcdF (DUF218 family)
MFFLLSKVLLIFLSPFFWIFILLLLALFSKKANRKRNYLIFGVLIFFLFSNSFLLSEVVRWWEVPPTKLQMVSKCDYAIVLGGFSQYDTVYHKMKLSEAGDRIWQTLQLYHQKKVSKIFVSGGSGKLMTQGETEADKVKGYLMTLGIPDKDVVIDPTSRNTHENALNTADWLKKHDPEAKCLLVTSAWHMRRALGCYKKAGLKVTAYSADWKAEPRKYDFDHLLLPQPNVLVDWNSTIKELTGYLTYRLMGYL